MEMKYGMWEGTFAVRKAVQRGFHCQGAMCGNAAFYLELLIAVAAAVIANLTQ